MLVELDAAHVVLVGFEREVTVERAPQPLARDGQDVGINLAVLLGGRDRTEGPRVLRVLLRGLLVKLLQVRRRLAGRHRAIARIDDNFDNALRVELFEFGPWPRVTLLEQAGGHHDVLLAI